MSSEEVMADGSSSSTTALEFDSQFIVMFLLAVTATMLTGSTVQWVMFRGGLFRPKDQPPPPSRRKSRSSSGPSFDRTYNIIVFVAALASGILAAGNFLMYCQVNTEHKNHAFLPIFVTVCWMTMTHASVMLVSKKLSMTYRNSDVVWKRLLLINAFMAPVSILVWTTWVAAHITGKQVWLDVSAIIEPAQIALWGLIEFILSGMFIVKMWKFNWTPVERKGIFVLILVAGCDLTTVLIYIVMGDIESTVMKAFVYCLRIRLEVGVLASMADFLQKKFNGSVYVGPSGTTAAAAAAASRLSSSSGLPLKYEIWQTNKSSTNSTTRTSCTGKSVVSFSGVDDVETAPPIVSSTVAADDDDHINNHDLTTSMRSHDLTASSRSHDLTASNDVDDEI